MCSYTLIDANKGGMWVHHMQAQSVCVRCMPNPLHVWDSGSGRFTIISRIISTWKTRSPRPLSRPDRVCESLRRLPSLVPVLSFFVTFGCFPKLS